MWSWKRMLPPIESRLQRHQRPTQFFSHPDVQMIIGMITDIQWRMNSHVSLRVAPLARGRCPIPRFQLYHHQSGRQHLTQRQLPQGSKRHLLDHQQRPQHQPPQDSRRLGRPTSFLRQSANGFGTQPQRKSFLLMISPLVGSSTLMQMATRGGGMRPRTVSSLRNRKAPSMSMTKFLDYEQISRIWLSW